MAIKISIFSRACGLLWLSVFFFTGCGGPPVREESPPIELAHVDLSPWHLVGTVEHYLAKDLDLVVEGDVNNYLPYGVKDIQLARIKSNESECRFLLFRCKSTEDAFGLYSARRVGIGLMDIVESVGGEISVAHEQDLVLAWKGRYFISLKSLSDIAPEKGELTGLATKIFSSRKDFNNRPKLVKALPRDNLLKSSVLLFRTGAILNKACKFPGEDFFRIGYNAGKPLLAEGVYGHYMFTRYDAEFLAILYREPETALKISDKMTRLYRKSADLYRDNPSGLKEAKLKSNFWILLWQKGPLLIFIKPTKGVRPARVLVQDYLNNLASESGSG